MRRFALLLIVLATTLGGAACSGAPAQPQAASGDDTCPQVSPGACPPGCTWNGTECRKQGGVIIFDRGGNGATSDADAAADAAAQ